jgi:hypothetical protein
VLWSSDELHVLRPPTLALNVARSGQRPPHGSKPPGSQRKSARTGRRPAAAAPGPVEASLDPTLATRLALGTLGAYLLVLLWVNLVLHTVPTYFVETDLMGDYIPSARALLAGHMQAGQYLFKGFGYPLLLAGAGTLCGGDFYLAARLLNVAAAIAGAWFSFLLFRRFLGPGVGLAVLLALALSPAFARCALEAGTDLPTFALSVAATHLVLSARSGRALAAAGFLAAYAVITRYNAAFLLAAAVVALLARPGRRAGLAWHAGGAALALGPWLLVNRALTGSPFTNANYQNVAYEMYSRVATWEGFWEANSGKFRSFWDVLRYDPALFATRLGLNLATRWLQDAQELMPLWLGVLAVPGMALTWWRRRGWAAIGLHFLLCYGALATVFYGARFSLYLLPFYLAGAAALVLQWTPPGWAWKGAGASIPRVLRSSKLRWALLAVLLVPSGVRALTEVHGLLAEAPVEVRLAGRMLRSLGPPGARVMARKPHVAYFAGMEFVALPPANDPLRLEQAARSANVRYLFYSGVEKHLRWQLNILEKRGLRLPGLEQLTHQVLPGGRFFVLYRFTGDAVNEDLMREPLLRELEKFVAERPGDALPHMALGTHLWKQGLARDALRELAAAESLAPGNPGVAMLQAQAYLQLRELDRAATACERCLELRFDTGPVQDLLGLVRLAQGRFEEAQQRFELALAREPATSEYYLHLASALQSRGDGAAGLRVVRACLDRDPHYAPARVYAARVFLRLGLRDRALAVLDEGLQPGMPAYPPLQQLADSLRPGPAR